MEDFQDILANLDKLQPQDRRLMALRMLTGACGSNRIRTYDLPGMNRTLWPAELLSQMVAGAGLEPATSGL